MTINNLVRSISRAYLRNGPVFVSVVTAGTGSSQNIAHGLAATPRNVFIIPETPSDVASTFVQGAHGSTNVVVTATLLTRFYVIAVK